MSEYEIREPIQKRSIEKKQKIIKAGFDLICEKGYYNTNTAEIAKAAGVSTGIVYNYFKDKHDILIAGIELYASQIFYPMLINTKKISDMQNLESMFRCMIDSSIKNHKLSQSAHEEIMAMTHSDKEIADFFHKYEMSATNDLVQLLTDKGITTSNLQEKVHISLGLMDNLCHEIVYHKHSSMNYKLMIDLVVKSIIRLFEED